jgi:protein-S-isoprenylcysteine O-methyltransferase Ste14
MDRLFQASYFVGILIQIVVRLPYNRHWRQSTKTDQRISATERGLLGLLFVGVFVIPLIFSRTTWLRFANYRCSPSTKAAAGILGTVTLGAALWLFWRSHRDLGANWSPSLEISTQHTLVTNGIYRHIRHPMYASQWLWIIAQPLLLQNWIAGLAGAVGFVPLYLVRVPREEQMMRDHFGEAYRAYAGRTGRIVPRLLRTT